MITDNDWQFLKYKQYNWIKIIDLAIDAIVYMWNQLNYLFCEQLTLIENKILFFFFYEKN